ncbi:MAG: hypothetical protein JSU68_11290 [Phycisphaerales bacterium]|nr:MAG: hypothetical protein JSU68_11290 [Phycisphaerales bacterium]
MGPLSGRDGWRLGTAGAVFAVMAVLAVTGVRAQERADDQGPETQQAGSDTQEPPTGEPVSPAQPDPEEIIRRLQDDRSPNVPIPPVRDQRETDEFFEPVGPSEELEPLLPEGAYLVDRAGRLVKRENWWTFVHEDRGEVVRSRPLRVLPSQLLETMEYASAEGTGDIVFVVSGEITEFHGVNYLLLRKVLIRRAMGNLGGDQGT